MSKKRYLSHAVAAAFVLASGASNVAFAVDEAEPRGTMGLNDSISTAQPLVFTTNTVEINGAIGQVVFGASPALIGDVDFFSFDGKAGDLLTANIDNGIKDSTTARSVHTVLAVFGPLPNTGILRQSLIGSPIDFPGSIHTQDARIDNPPVLLPSDGTYIVGVSSSPRTFLPGGGLASSLLGQRSNGSYTLILSGVTPTAPLVQYMNIEIKPGSDEVAPINPRARGNIPVALLSSRDFDALKVDRNSLTFGRTGGEKSFLRCSKEGSYVNADDLMDLVCHFDNQAAAFQADDLEGTAKGLFTDSKEQVRPFEGRAYLKVVPGKLAD